MSDLQRFFARTNAMSLGQSGRFKEAISSLDSDDDLVQLLCFMHGRELTSSSGNFADAMTGWRAYFRAAYADAAAHFASGLDEDFPWLFAWSALGLAKVATDTGHLATAIRWASSAAAVARHFECLDLLSEISGARGEIYLRAGRPMLASEAFALDLALLPAGSRYRGRVLCYTAHAHVRMGCAAWPLAEAAYRIAAHTPGEHTDPFALAGLALLGAEWASLERGRSALVDEALHALGPTPAVHVGSAWIHVARARVAFLRHETPDPWCSTALALFPPEHPFERRWLTEWARGMSVPLADAGAATAAAADTPRFPTWRAHRRARPTAFDSHEADETLPEDAFATGTTLPSAEESWRARLRFMP